MAALAGTQTLVIKWNKQQLVFPNGSRIAVTEPVFVNEGTAPAGATWSRLPLPGVGYGHRCACKIVMLFSICCCTSR